MSVEEEEDHHHLALWDVTFDPFVMGPMKMRLCVSIMEAFIHSQQCGLHNAASILTWGINQRKGPFLMMSSRCPTTKVRLLSWRNICPSLDRFCRLFEVLCDKWLQCSCYPRCPKQLSLKWAIIYDPHVFGDVSCLVLQEPTTGAKASG